jgi:hypothetical protein
MKRLLMFKGVILLVAAYATLSTVSSCKKTVEVVIHDTTAVQAVDTMFAMVALNWDGYAYTPTSIVSISPGSTTYTTTTEGIKFMGQGYRLGSRIQTKNEIRFTNKTIYFKWKANGAGQFANIIPQIKYDAKSNDATPAIQGVDLHLFSVNGTFNGSTQVQENTWYYTRVSPVAGTDNYTVATATTNYDNKGGTVVISNVIPVYTKAGYLGIRIGDPYGGTSAYGVLGECKVSAN